MSKIISQDKIFLEKEGDDYFERNGPSVNQAIYKAIKFLRPKKKDTIFEIGCGCGSTLKKAQENFKSQVWGIDTSKKAINYAIRKHKLKHVFTDTFLNFSAKNKFNIVVSGGFLYVTPDKILPKTINKMINFVKKDSYLVIWDYDTPVSYENSWKYNNKVKSYKRNLVNIILKKHPKLYLVSKILSLINGKKLDSYNNSINIDNIFSVMIFRKIS